MAIIAAFKLSLMVLCVLVYSPLAWAAFKLKKYRLRDWLMCKGSRALLWCVGVRVSATGELAVARPLLLVSNHVSYLDIPVIGTHAPVVFTPKSEIAGWPFLGWLAKVQSSVFINRTTDKFRENTQMLREALSGGALLSLFPEGTTGNGLNMLPFKSAFFSLAEEPIGGEALVVQPLAISYTRIRNLPIDITQWPDVAWYGDMLLLPHLWKFLQMTPVSVKLQFLAPVSITDFADRKELSKHCQQVISDALIDARN